MKNLSPLHLSYAVENNDDLLKEFSEATLPFVEFYLVLLGGHSNVLNSEIWLLICTVIF